MNEIRKVEESQVPLVAEIKVQLFQNGQIQVRSSNPDKILNFGLLEFAKQLIGSQRQESLVQVPQLQVPSNLKIPGNS